MKFETLRLMAQDYADRHKEPQSLPATVDTMAYAYQRICQGEDPWTALGDFSNAWYGYAKHIRPDLVKDPLIRPAQETEATRRWGAFCAASVEYLCALHHQPCPQWVHNSSFLYTRYSLVVASTSGRSNHARTHTQNDTSTFCASQHLLQ
jgi:hypothetical protein